VDGNDTCGRLEVFAFDGWRAVCPQNFDSTDANVACIHMGFGYVCVLASCNHYDDETKNDNKR